MAFDERFQALPLVLANGRFEVGRDKTDAGMREVDMLPLLREILTAANRHPDHGPTSVQPPGENVSAEGISAERGLRGRFPQTVFPRGCRIMPTHLKIVVIGPQWLLESMGGCGGRWRSGYAYGT